jgi:S1-C subfamily serine protease
MGAARRGGFVVDQRRRYILTWCKPVLQTGKISVEFFQPGAAPRSAAATIRECDSYTGFAVIEIESVSGFPPALQLDTESLVLSGAQVYALGVNGVSVKIPGRVVNARTDFGFIETHSSLEPSTSRAVNVEDMLHDMSPINGGPLIEKNGKVIGVNQFSRESKELVPTVGPAKAGIPKGTYYAWPVRSPCRLSARRRRDFDRPRQRERTVCQADRRSSRPGRGVTGVMVPFGRRRNGLRSIILQRRLNVPLRRLHLV